MPDNYVETFGRHSRSPAFTTHDLKLTKEFTNVNEPERVGVAAYVSIENVFDFTRGSPIVDAANPFSDTFDSIYTRGANRGRTFLLGVRVNLRQGVHGSRSREGTLVSTPRQNESDPVP